MSEASTDEVPAPPLFRIEGLGVRTSGAAQPELDDFSLVLAAGGTVTLLGETGCGKEALLRVLLGSGARGENVSGTIRIGGGEAGPLQRVRNLRTAYLPGPLRPVLNPHASVLSQLSRVVARKLRQPRGSARAELSLALGRLPGAPNTAMLDHLPAQVAPEDLAAALLASAVSQTPELVVAADPLAELSPAHARALAAALEAEQKRLGFALVYAANSVDAARILGGNLIVMRGGRVVEEGPLSRLATAQSHAYTQTLFRATAAKTKEPPPAPVRAGPRGEAVLRVQGVRLNTPAKQDTRETLTFELRRGGALALVGEEGSGRRALTRALLGLDPVAAGRVVFDQVDIGILSSGMMSRLRRRIAFVTGEDDALDPRLTIFDAVAEPLRAHLRMTGEQIARNRDAALKRVGLAALPGSRTVASLSRFDRRRLQIARAIVGAPLLAVIDEPLRGLDAFAQSVMRDLLRSLRGQENPAFLVITSDFALAQAFCEEAFVFKDGRIVERGPILAMLRAPKEEYTRKLVDAGVPKSALPPAPAEG